MHLPSQQIDEFLQRVERQRLESECLRPLDLRPKVSGPCKRYSYRGRSLWLDATGHELFLDGLQKNAGVFTVETYEAILRRLDSKHIDPPGIATEPSADTHTHADSDDLPHPWSGFRRTSNNLAFDLSYFEKRVYERFKIMLDLRLVHAGKAYSAETRDISIAGLQLRIRQPIDLQEGDPVLVDVSLLTDRRLEKAQLDYRVVRVRRLLSDTLLALECVETEPKDGLIAIADQIAASSEAASLEQSDPEDALLTARALLAERYYMRSTGILPFFLFEDGGNESPLRIIFSNPSNERALKAFEIAPGHYDLRALVTPWRIKLLMRLALRDSKADTLIAVYRTNPEEPPQVRADLECKNHKHWCRLLKKYAELAEFRVYKVVARAARRPAKMRIENAIEPLAKQGDEFVSNLLLAANRLSIVGAFIDVTEQIRGWRQGACDPEQAACEEPVTCHDERQHLPPPRLVPVNYIQENRREARFLGRMPVAIHIADQTYQGETRDVSAHGLSVTVDMPDIDTGSEHPVSLSFPKLEARSTGLARIQGTFRNVPAEIVGGFDAEHRQLRFRIGATLTGRQFSNAFANYLSRREANLRKDNSHSLRAATSRLYSSIFVESSPTIPVFIYRATPGDWTLKLGMASCPSPISEFFEVADGEFDFNVFTRNGRLERLMQQVSEQGHGDLTLYLRKERCRDLPRFTLHALADFEIADDRTRRDFVQQALEHEFRCVKILANRPDIPPQAEIDQATERLSRLSPGKGERLKAEFSGLIAVGDILDITGLVEDTWN